MPAKSVVSMCKAGQADSGMFRPTGPSPAEVELPKSLRLMGGSAANGDKSDPVVFQGDVEHQMRALLVRYGFARLPLTYGELAGLMEYCNELDSAAGFGMFDDDMSLRVWQTRAMETWGADLPALVPVLRMYMKGDVSGLLKLHRDQDTLTELGKRWREFPL